MHYGIYTPNFGDDLDVRSLATLAQEAEEAGWDGFFLWDHILYRANPPVRMVDPWIALTAITMVTERIRIGTTVTPLARRHPWKLARETRFTRLSFKGAFNTRRWTGRSRNYRVCSVWRGIRQPYTSG